MTQYQYAWAIEECIKNKKLSKQIKADIRWHVNNMRERIERHKRYINELEQLKRDKYNMTERDYNNQESKLKIGIRDTKKLILKSYLSICKMGYMTGCLNDRDLGYAKEAIENMKKEREEGQETFRIRNVDIDAGTKRIIDNMNKIVGNFSKKFK